MSKDLYEILGVSRDADEKTIKSAYRKKALALHPDKQVGKSDAEKKKAEDEFKEVQQAYDVLSDKDKKQKYDMFGTIDGDASSQGSGFGRFNFDFGFGGADPFADIRDIFGGGGSRRQSRERIVPGRTIQMKVPLNIEDIYCGCKKTVKYKIDTRCPNCHGSGGQTHKCPHCNGTGVETKVTRSAFGITQQQMVCSHCGGTGEIVDKTCPSCHGTGFRTTDKTLDVEFAPGIMNETGIKYPQQGSEAKKAGHPNGDFIALAVWNFDTDRYTISGLDITEKIHINYEDALLGTKYHLVLPDKKAMEITIEPCTPPGKKLMLRGRGITGNNIYGVPSTGNYIIEVVYDVPQTLTEAEKKHLQEIKKLH